MSGIISDNVGRASGLLKAVAAPSSDVVKLATATVTGVTSATFDGYFSADYNRYEVVCSNLLMAGTGSDLWFRVRVGGSTDAQSLYVNTNGYQYTDGTPTHQLLKADTGSQDTNAPSNYWKGGADDMGTDSRQFVHYTLYDPLNADKFKMMKYLTGYAGSTILQNVFGHGVWEANTALTGMEVWSSSDNFAGVFNLYGYK